MDDYYLDDDIAHAAIDLVAFSDYSRLTRDDLVRWIEELDGPTVYDRLVDAESFDPLADVA